MDSMVGIIIGDSFALLAELAKSMPVWAPDIPLYRSIAQEIWSSQVPNQPVLTLYKVFPDENVAATFPSLLDTIDLHHGSYSQKNAWKTLLIYGLPLTLEVRKALAAHGADMIWEIPE